MVVCIGLKYTVYIIYYHTPIRIRDTLTTLGGVVYLRNGLVVCDWWYITYWWYLYRHYRILLYPVYCT